MKNKFFNIGFFFFFMLLIFLFSAISAENGMQAKGWKSGVSKIVITPGESLWMAGYASRDHPSEGVLHDLWAKAVALEDMNGSRAVIITTDLVGFRGEYMIDRIRNQLKSKYGLSQSQVIISYSHTHSGPELMKSPDDYLGREDSTGPYSALQREKIIRYSGQLENKIVKIVGEAINSLEPVKIYSGQGVARFAVNRRMHREKTEVVELVQELDGPVDHSVPVIKIQKASGKLLAVIFGYACHNTTLSIYKFSGDYAGFAQIALEDAYPETTALFFAGCGADQNPLPRRTVALAQQYGKTLAAAVEAVITEPMRELSPKISTAYSEVELNFADPIPIKDDLLKAIKTSKTYPGTAKNLLYRMENGQLLSSSSSYPIQFWRIGEQNLIVLASEVVVDYSLKFKQIFGKDIFVMAYANGGMGYIPSTRVLSEGGYESDRSPNFTGPWASDIEMKIVLGIMRLAEQADNKTTLFKFDY